MKELLTLLIFLIFNSLSHAQGWETLIGSNRADDATDVSQTSDGGFIAVGYTTENNPRGQDILLAKLDQDGRIQWQKNIGRPFVAERGYAVASNPDGSFMVAGVTASDTSNSTTQVLLMKCNARGDTIWTRTYLPNFCTSAAFGLVRLRDGGFAMTGQACVLGREQMNILLLRTDANGNLLWQNQFSETGKLDFGKRVYEAADGGLFIAGVRGVYGIVEQRAIVLKTNALGQLQWKKVFGSLGVNLLNDCANILPTSDGGCVATGVFTDSVRTTGTFLRRFAADGREILSKLYIDFLWAFSVHRTASGGFALISGNLGGERLREFMTTDSLGNILSRRQISAYNRSDDLKFSIQTADKSYVSIGNRTTNGNKDLHLVKLNTEGAVNAYRLSGTLYFDENNSCNRDANERPLANWLVKAERTGATYYAMTDSLGNYSMALDGNPYLVSLVKPNAYWLPCQDSLFIGLSPNFTQHVQNFPIKRRINCPLLDVDVATPYLRRCFENTYKVRYCNRGTATAQNAFVKVTLDKWLIFNTSTRPLSRREGNTLFFNIGNVAQGDCSDFSFTATLRCDSTYLGQTHCVEAKIFPDSICLPTNGWSGATVAVNGACLRDSVEFQIRNTGNGATRAPIDYVIVEDDIIFLRGLVNSNLQPNGTNRIKLPATGKTYRLNSSQEPNHPNQNSRPTAVVEGCRPTPILPLSIGYVTQFPEDDGDPFTSIDCRANQGAFDPNDKSAQPQGIGNQHFIDEQAELDYTIRFQNTGTDTAFTVVLRDTLSRYLDINSLKLGASSHRYTAEIVGVNVVKITFPNIQLPDSFRNKLQSQGFIKMTVKLKADVPFFTTITNSAAIYFDFNPPIITNKVSHTLRKPIRFYSRNVPLCDNMPFNGRFFAKDTRLYDTLRFAKFDSISLFNIQVLPTYKLTKDSAILRGANFKGINVQHDTAITIRYIAKNGCDSSVTFRLRILTATHELTPDQIRVFPNPMTDATTFELPPQYVGDFELKIYDLTGKIWKKQTAKGNVFEFRRADLPSGLYLFELTKEREKVVLGKIIVH